MKYAKGIMWLDDCRIPFVDEGENKLVFDRSGKGGYRKEFVGCEIKEEYKWDKQQGRFTPNLLVCDDLLNDGSISSGKVGMTQQASSNEIFNKFTSKGDTKINDGHKDKGTNSRYYDLDIWFDKVVDNL